MPFCLLAACSKASLPSLSFDREDAVLLKLGPAYLTRSEMESRMLEIGPDYVPYLRTEQGKKTLLNAIVKGKLLARVALEQGLDRNENFKEDIERVKKDQQRALRVYKESLLRENLLNRLRQKELKVDEAAAASYFKEHKNLYSVRHILLANEKSAASLLVQIKRKRNMKAEEFGRMAKSYSMEASSARNMGAVAPFLEGELDENFERAARALKSNQISDVVTTEFGYHIIFLEKAASASFNDEMKNRVTSILEKKRLESLIALWKDKYPLEVKDETIRRYLDF